MTDDERVRHALYPLFNDGLIPSYDDVSVGHLAELAAKELAALRACAEAPAQTEVERLRKAAIYKIGVMAMTAQSDPYASAATYRQALVDICNFALKVQDESRAAALAPSTDTGTEPTP